MSHGVTGVGALPRIGTALAAGLAAYLLSRATAPPGHAPLLAWVAASGSYLGWTWLVLRRVTAEATSADVTREDPSRTISHLVILLASLASVFGVAMMIASSSQQGSGATFEAVLGLASVALAWLVVQTVYTVRYADIYYSAGGRGVDFNAPEGEDPDYLDFAYLAFTLGMTYQVSDTNLTTKDMRRAVLRHTLLSYFLGAVVLAMTINLVVQLAAA